MALWRIGTGQGERLARGPVAGGPVELLPAEHSLAELLSGGAAAFAEAVAEGGPADGPVPAQSTVLAPLDAQEVWAAGVTFNTSRSARNDESGGAHDFYDLVYSAERPELFFKASPGRARGPGALIGVRADSGWDVPEPELALLAAADGGIAAFTIGNDVSSRSIEGENPLYLPQAKVYRGSCAVGPCLVPVAEAPDPEAMEIRLGISREGGEVFTETTQVALLKRTPEELLRWLFRAEAFPAGVLLLTGTSIIPAPEFTLRAGDEVRIAITGLGELVNTVEVVGT